MTLDHKVGDKVKIRSDLNTKPDLSNRGPGLNSRMKGLAGCWAIINRIKDDYYRISLDNGTNVWEDWMFEEGTVFVGESLYED